MRKTKAQLETELMEALRQNTELRELNATQLTRLTGDELLKIRINELEGMLDDAIDEREAARGRAEGAERALERKAQAYGMSPGCTA